MKRPKPDRPAGQDSYVDAYRVGTPAPSPAKPRAGRPKAPAASEPAQAQRRAEPGRRVRTNLYIDRDQFAEARGAVVRLAASGREPGNLSALVEDALERELARLRAKFNSGKPFPPHGGLPGGRPRG